MILEKLNSDAPELTVKCICYFFILTLELGEIQYIQ